MPGKPFDSSPQYDSVRGRRAGHIADLRLAYATVQSDIFKPTKFGGKYTVTLIPGMRPAKAKEPRYFSSKTAKAHVNR